MVSGKVIRSLLTAVRKKKGVEGLKKVIDEINTDTIFFTDVEEVKPSADYPPEMARKVLSSVEKALGENVLAEYLFQTTTKPFILFRKGKRIRSAVEKAVAHAHRQFPLFSYSIEVITDHAYRITVRGTDTAQIYLKKKIQEIFPNAKISSGDGVLTVRIEED